MCKCQENVPIEDRDLILIRGDSLQNGHTQSCGCIHSDVVSKICKARKKYNQYDLTGKYGIGYAENENLNKTHAFYFDLEDYDNICNYFWYFNSHGYVESKTSDGTIMFSRVIMGTTDKDIQVDHIHGKLSRNDNRKCNLREVTISQNKMNVGLRANNTSGKTGVTWDKDREAWQVRIVVNNQIINIGRFKKREDADKARDDAENKYFGDFRYETSQNMPYDKTK